MVVGDGVDAADLTKCLRKKLCHASIEIVEEVKKEPPKQPPKPPTKPIVCYCPQQPLLKYCKVVSDPCPDPCTIL
ncbi:hypothetical protein DITRI_Ditri12bG0103800 [Diplodiscus trichospermus]